MAGALKVKGAGVEFRLAGVPKVPAALAPPLAKHSLGCCPPMPAAPPNGKIGLAAVLAEFPPAEKPNPPLAGVELGCGAEAPKVNSGALVGVADALVFPAAKMLGVSTLVGVPKLGTELLPNTGVWICPIMKKKVQSSVLYHTCYVKCRSIDDV